MNRLTIIKVDNTVGVDGNFLPIDCSSLPENFHALQWNQNTSMGEVEWNGNPKPQNTIITELGQYQTFVDQWKQLNPIATEMPVFDEDTQKCVEVSPVEQNGNWYQAWSVVNLTTDELLIKKNQLISEITSYRDQKIAEGFLFNGVMYDSRPEDQKRISGAALLAFMAITQGAQANDFYWNQEAEPFSWISKSNSLTQMDAPTVVGFGKKAAEHEKKHIFAARQLKDMNLIPKDYTNPIYWP